MATVGLSLQTGTLQGHPHPAHMGCCGMHEAGLEAGAGEGLDPIISPVPRLPSCSLAPLLPLALLVLLLGVLRIPRASARMTP